MWKPSDRGQDQGQGVVGHLVDEGVGHVGDQDALASGRLDVDVVVPDGRPQHEARARRLPNASASSGRPVAITTSAAAVSGGTPPSAPRITAWTISRPPPSRTARVSGQTTDPGAPTHTTRGPLPAPSPPREIGLHVLRSSLGRPSGRKREVTARQMARADGRQLGRLPEAPQLDERTAGVELAADGRLRTLGISPFSSTSSRR